MWSPTWVSRRLSVIVGFLVCGAAIIGAGAAPGFALLTLTQVLWAFGSTFRSGAETAWYTDEIGSVGLVNLVLPRRARFESAGSIVGVLATATLASIVGLSISLAAMGSILMAWGLVLVARMPETGFTRPNAAVRNRFRRRLSEGVEASRRPALRVLLFVTLLTGFASEAVDRLDIARLDQIGLPTTIDPALLIGAVVVTQMVGSIVVLIAFGRQLTGRRLVSVSVALNAVTGVGVALLARADLLVIALAGVIGQEWCVTWRGRSQLPGPTISPTVRTVQPLTPLSAKPCPSAKSAEALSSVSSPSAAASHGLSRSSAGVYFMAAGAAAAARRAWSAPTRSRR